MSTPADGHPAGTPASPVPVFVDCDNTMGMPGAEIDDGLTILYLLAHPTVRIVGIGATHGNARVAQVMLQTRELLDRLQLDIPLREGFDPWTATDRASSAAARALSDASREYEGRLVVLGLGALTNLAGAMELDPGFVARVAAINVMGGYRGPLAFRRREVGELNFSSDPGAAERVLYAAAPVTILSAQLCLQARFGLRHLLVHNRGPAWLRPVVSDWYRTFSRATGAPGFYLWDLVPAAAVVEPARIPPAWYRLRSTVNDLRTGTLVLERPARGDGQNVGPNEPGVVSVPEVIRRRHRFAGDCARAWRRSASAGTRSE